MQIRFFFFYVCNVINLSLHQAIKAETDGLREELEFVRTLGADLIFACGETEKPEVKKTIDEVRHSNCYLWRSKFNVNANGLMWFVVS